MKPIDPDKTIRQALQTAKKASGGAVIPKRKLDSMGMYSKGEEIAKGLPQERGNVDQMLAMMSNRGVKPAEMLNAGKPLGDSISKAELAEHFKSKAPQIKVKKLTQDDEHDDTIYKDYTMAGGEEYQEHLLHLPSNVPDEGLRFKMDQDHNNSRVNRRAPFGDFHSDHWQGVPNILAHLRMKDYKNFVKSDAYNQLRSDFNEAAVQRDLAYKHFQKSNKDFIEAEKEARLKPGHWREKEKSRDDLESASLKHVNIKRLMDKLPKEKTLHLEELQSDWAQTGRDKGFYDPKNPHTLYKGPSFKSNEDEVVGHFPTAEALNEHVESLRKSGELTDDHWSKHRSPGNVIEEPPIGPYVTNTQHWMDLGLKHLLHEAAKGNYDKVSWTPGDEQAKRYSLSNHVGSVAYEPEYGSLSIKNPEGKSIAKKVVDRDELETLLGKELTSKLLLTKKESREFSEQSHNIGGPHHYLEGLDLKVGGEGMKKYYDGMVPKSLLKLARQHDPEARIVPHLLGGEYFNMNGRIPEENVQALEITPKMRESILRGQSHFASGGAVNPNPTEAQKEAGNYSKEHISFQGLPISLENKKGTTRSGVGPDGRKWSVQMPYDYGYVKGTEGADGDHFDVCIGPNPNSNSVFIVDQKDAKTGRFDEHKAMLGYNTLVEAEQAYKSGFSDGKGYLRLGPVVRLTISEFKKWLGTNETKTANKTQGLVDRALKLSQKCRETYHV